MDAKLSFCAIFELRKVIHMHIIILISSFGTCRAQPRPGRVRDRGGAAGEGEAGEAVGAQEDQTGGHDQAVATGEDKSQGLYPKAKESACGSMTG